MHHLALVQSNNNSCIKFHGALYNRSQTDQELANYLIGWMIERHIDCVTTLAHGALAEKAHAHDIAVRAEGFLDRAYTADGHLVPRSVKHSLITSAEEWAQRVTNHHTTQTITALNGTAVPSTVDIWTVHGDDPMALKNIQTLKEMFA